MNMPSICLVALACLTSAPCFAQNWSGHLVDSRCYDSMERSVNPFDVSPDVNRDKDLEIRLCTPSFKTKSFAVVFAEGTKSFRLDPIGNERAVALVRKTGRKALGEVTVTGELHASMIEVNSISETK